MEAVGRFVAPSAFAADRLGELGLQRDRISVAHNFLPASSSRPRHRTTAPEYALFAGRLVEEKGVDTAVEAAAHAGVPLAIAGTGPEAEPLEALARSTGAPVRFLGLLEPAEVRAALAPRGVRGGAVALGRAVPVLGDRGDGGRRAGARVRGAAGCRRWWARSTRSRTATWRPGRSAMRALWDDPDLRRARGREALERARDLFGPERFYAALMDAYEAAGPR